MIRGPREPIHGGAKGTKGWPRTEGCPEDRDRANVANTLQSVTGLLGGDDHKS